MTSRTAGLRATSYERRQSDGAGRLTISDTPSRISRPMRPPLSPAPHSVWTGAFWRIESFLFCRQYATLWRMFARACFAILATSCLAFSQNSTGTISGLITDPSNAGIPKAEIMVTNENTGLRRIVESNETGAYRLPFLPVGTYSVVVKREGFRSEIQKGVELEILQVRTVDFMLQVGAVTETVTVQGEAAMLEAETSQAGEVIKTEQVTN